MRLNRFAAAWGALVLAVACQSSPEPVQPAAPAPYAGATNIFPPSEIGFAFSPDNQTLLAASDEGGGVFNVYAQTLANGDRRELTQAARDAFAISYFTADERVLVRLIQEDGGGHVGARFEDGVVRDLTPGASDTRFLGWRTDRRAFFVAVASGEALAFAAYAIDASSYQRTLLYEADGDIDAVSRDGRWLAFTQLPNIYVVDLQAPQVAPRLVATHRGMAGPTIYEFSADGRSLIYAADAPGAYVQAWRYDLASGEHTPVMQAQADVLNVTSSPSGRYRVFVLGQDSVPADVIIIDQQSDRALPLSGAIRDARFNADETQLLFRLANDPWPRDIFVSGLDGANMRRVVHAPRAGAGTE